MGFPSDLVLMPTRDCKQAVFNQTSIFCLSIAVMALPTVMQAMLSFDLTF